MFTVINWFMLEGTFKDHLAQHSLSQLGTSFPKSPLILPQQAWIMMCKEPMTCIQLQVKNRRHFRKYLIFNTLGLCSYSGGTVSHIHPGISTFLLILSRATSGAKLPWKKLHNSVLCRFRCQILVTQVSTLTPTACFGFIIFRHDHIA